MRRGGRVGSARGARGEQRGRQSRRPRAGRGGSRWRRCGPRLGPHLAERVALHLLRHALVEERAAASGRRVSGVPRWPRVCSARRLSRRRIRGPPAPARRAGARRQHPGSRAARAGGSRGERAGFRPAKRGQAGTGVGAQRRGAASGAHSLSTLSISTFFCVPVLGFAMLSCGERSSGRQHASACGAHCRSGAVSAYRGARRAPAPSCCLNAAPRYPVRDGALRKERPLTWQAGPTSKDKPAASQRA
jgi:hypothetical protein